MKITGVGSLTKHPRYDRYRSKRIAIPVLFGKVCRIVVEGYDEDPQKEEFHTAINNFLSIDESVLRACEQYVFHYYQDCNADWDAADDEYVAVPSPSNVWDHIQLGGEPTVIRRDYGDKGIYINLGCGCDWEIEHGLQIVFKNGLKVNKVGSYDGHLTNSDAYADDSLENVVYRA